jgi:alpha-ribazole phosphatase
MVIHSGTVRAALAIALGIAPESALSFRVDPLSLTRIDHVESHCSVVCVNC